jgi:hypothetical protein
MFEAATQLEQYGYMAADPLARELQSLAFDYNFCCNARRVTTPRGKRSHPFAL